MKLARLYLISSLIGVLGLLESGCAGQFAGGHVTVEGPLNGLLDSWGHQVDVDSYKSQGMSEKQAEENAQLDELRQQANSP